MVAYLVQRLVLLVFTFLAVLLIAFVVTRLAPGDPVDVLMGGGLGAGGEGLASEQLANRERAKEELRRQLGLDRPVVVQYLRFVGGLLTGDLGRSFKDSQPVLRKIAERVPLTLTLSGLSILITFAIAIPLGILCAVRSGTWIDRFVTVVLYVLYSLPNFWIGTLIIVFLCAGDYLAWFPPAGIRSLAYDPNWPWYHKLGDFMHHLAMPLLVTTYAGFAFLSRILRASMLDVRDQDYIRTARAKGLPERTVILKHVLRNSIIPLVTNVGLLLPALIGGSVIVETIFSLPGVGFLGFQAVLARDYPVVMGLFAITSGLTLVGILISDLALAWVDPRIDFGGRLR